MRRPTETMISGTKHRATHQASVDAILTNTSIRRVVISAGSEFLNIDNWYLRSFAKEFCVWAASNDKKSVKYVDCTNILQKSNSYYEKNPHIRIAHTPDKISEEIASALTGSAYHEAWHTLYSHRERLSTKEATTLLNPYSSQITWAGMEEHLLFLMNLIEDIRIERIGCTMFPGTRKRMENLQDYMIDKECEISEGYKNFNTMSFFVAIFRELGKDYDTPRRKEALKLYKDKSPVVYSWIENGILSDILKETKGLTTNDSTACLPLAMRIIVKIREIAEASNTTAQNIVKDGTSSTNDLSSLLKRIISGQIASTRDGPDIFHPYSTNDDIVLTVQKNQREQFFGSQPTIDRFNITEKNVKSVTLGLRTHLRYVFKANEFVTVEHGVRTGRQLSGRLLADTIASVRSGSTPDRPYSVKAEAPDLSLAASIIIDGSGSMSNKIEETYGVLLALTEALDSIGGKTAVAGFCSRPGFDLQCTSNENVKDFHRFHSVVYHMFKDFDERFLYKKDLFKQLPATGCTPMGDGINFGITLLSPRKEGHRFMFVLTDGMPDNMGPVRNRLKLAESLGIRVIGIGLDSAAAYVKDCYPDHACAEDILELPAVLIRKITDIVDRNFNKRGKSAKNSDLVR